MMTVFSAFGMCVAILLGIVTLSLVCGWCAEDDDHIMKWLFVCVIYAITTTTLIIKLRT